jgi:transglutaminase-like putative cysteine protease
VPDRLTLSSQVLDHRGIEWARVRRAVTVVEQRFRYEYPGPIRELRHRLIVFPPDQHGGQRLVARELRVSQPATVREERDAFGNLVCYVETARVEREIEFEARIVVERARRGGYPYTRPMNGRRYLEPTRLTAPDSRLSEAALTLARAGGPVGLVERINEWVWRALRYTHGVTDVQTTAAEALALGRGVCQDYAHLMLALCRLLNLPARYVSGHLLGEGATHAWVEVLAPDPADPGHKTIQAFDPTHGRRCRADYVTVALGRDYADVAPTSGSFVAPYGGTLYAHKQAGLTDLEYDEGAAA